jgi:hypothetical protein
LKAHSGERLRITRKKLRKIRVITLSKNITTGRSRLEISLSPLSCQERRRNKAIMKSVIHQIKKRTIHHVLKLRKLKLARKRRKIRENSLLL